MTEENAASVAEVQQVPLDLNQASSGRRTNLLVKAPPSLVDDKARELEKSGVISGLAPPSQILDGTVPLVDLEYNRLHEAMTWVYDSVRSLKKQSASVEDRLSSLQDLFKQMNSGSADTVEVPSEAQEGNASATEDAPSPSHGSSAMRRMVQQLEQKRSASEKLLEMRLDSLKSDVDQRLQAKDLQDCKTSLIDHLKTLVAQSGEDLGNLNNMIHSESAAERRRIQAQLETVTGRLSEQIETADTRVSRNLEFIQQFEARLAALEGGRSPNSSRTRSVPLAGAQVADRELIVEDRDLPLGDDSRVGNLEASVARLEARLQEFANGGMQRPFAMPVEVSNPEAAGDATNLAAAENPQDINIFAALMQLQQRVDRLDSMGSIGSGAALEFTGDIDGTNVHQQLVEFHRAHTEMHKKILDAGVRIQLLEQGGIPAAAEGGGANHKAAMELAELTSRIATLENDNVEIFSKLDELDQKESSHQKHNAQTSQRLAHDMNNLVRYVAGDSSLNDEAASPSNSSVKGEWPLAWLERRVEALVKKKSGACLEERLQSIEKGIAASSSADTSGRLKKLEGELRTLDVNDLRRVRPDLTEFQKAHEVFSRDLEREMKELKVVVGCVEACIPRETRKAVQLFKRAAGSGDGVPISPRDFAVESKILALREDMETQIKDATTSLENGRERMASIVKGLEKKQEMLESHLEDVRRNSLRPSSQTTSRPPTQQGAQTDQGLPELPVLTDLKQDAGAAVPPLRASDAAP